MKRRLIAVLGLRHLLVTAIFVSTSMTLAVVALTAQGSTILLAVH